MSSVDDGPLDRWPELFTDDCSYRIVSRENHQRGLPLAVMRGDSRDMLRDRVDAIRSTAFYVPRTIRHVVGLLDVTAADRGIGVKSSVAVYQSLPLEATSLLCVGTYDDVIVRDGGVLRFREKCFVHDGDLLTDSVVYPL